MSSTTSDGDFRIISSLRYDPILLTSEENSRSELNFISPSPFYMLKYHRDRLLEAAQHFEFSGAVQTLSDGKALHEALLQEVKKLKDMGGQDEALKVRLALDKTGKLSAELTPVPPISLQFLYPSSLDKPGKASKQHSQKPKPEVSPLTGGALEIGDDDTLLPNASQTDKSSKWVLKLDQKPTPSSPFTLLKTTVRDIYNSSRSRALPTNTQAPTNVEVMLFNECNELTEGSITSLYIYRGGRWVTPPVGVPAGHLDASTLKSDGDSGQNSERWDEGELRKPFAGRWGHSVRSAKVGAGGQRGTTRRWALSKGMCMEEPVSIETVSVGEGVWVSNGVIGFGYGLVVG